MCIVFGCTQVPHILYHGAKNDRALLRSRILLQHRIPIDRAAAAVSDDTGSGARKYYKTAPVVITSYEIAMQDRPFIADHSWKLLIVDEGHRIKNSKCRLIR